MDRDRAAWPRLALAGLLATALITRLAPHLHGLHGEQDAARLMVDALAWLEAGVRNEALSEYRYYTSPGYIALAALIIPLARLLGAHPALLLGWINLALGVAMVIPVFRLAARLAGPGTAALATLILLFMPMMWHASTYGFPHLPAVFCLLCALLIYDRHLTGPPWLGPRADLVAVLALLTACVLFKADSYLGVAGLFGLLLVRRQITPRQMAVAAGLVLAPVALAAGVAQALLQESPTLAGYMQGYERQYPTALWHLRSWWHIEGWLMAFGFFTVPLAAVGGLVTLIRRRWRLAVMMAVWVAVPMAFWFLRPGDSARHHLPEAFPVALAAALALMAPGWRPWLPAAGLLALLGANHARYPPTGDNFRPSGRVLATVERMRERVARYHQAAAAYAGAPEPRRVYLGGITNPYVDSELLLQADEVLDVVRTPMLGYDAIQIRLRREGTEVFSASVRVNAEDAAEAARRFQEAGYVPYSMETDMASEERTEDLKLRKLSPP